MPCCRTSWSAPVAVDKTKLGEIAASFTLEMAAYEGNQSNLELKCRAHPEHRTMSDRVIGEGEAAGNGVSSERDDVRARHCELRRVK